MIIIKFMNKLYEVVPDNERDKAMSSCDNCCFKNDHNHACSTDNSMRHIDGRQVQGCVEGEHFYREL